MDKSSLPPTKELELIAATLGALALRLRKLSRELKSPTKKTSNKRKTR